MIDVNCGLKCFLLSICSFALLPCFDLSQLDTYLNEEYPCTKEAALFCSSSGSSLSPEDTLSCLESIAATSPGDISLECAAVLDGFSACKEGPPGGPDGKDGGAMPKPKPRALSASAATQSNLELSSVSSSEEEDEVEEKEEGRERGDRGKEKPRPKDKPKPAPGSESGRRCWVGRGGRGAEGEERGFLGGDLGELFGSDSGSDSGDEGAHSPGGYF